MIWSGVHIYSKITTNYYQNSACSRHIADNKAFNESVLINSQSNFTVLVSVVHDTYFGLSSADMENIVIKFCIYSWIYFNKARYVSRITVKAIKLLC